MAHASLWRKETRLKQIEYVLLTAFTGAVGVACGGLLWPALSPLAPVFTQITHVLQVKP
jgi:hypothetical protein